MTHEEREHLKALLEFGSPHVMSKPSRTEQREDAEFFLTNPHILELCGLILRSTPAGTPQYHMVLAAIETGFYLGREFERQLQLLRPHEDLRRRLT